MIFTKNWINEWIDVKKIEPAEIVETCNRIGLEVAEARELKAPEGVVVGKVEQCEKHPDADKLSICQVNIGTEVCQIVCGAKNIAKDQFVCVATLGTTLPNGMTMKPVELRGVQSTGMICSSDELGFGKVNEGILVLDGSIGKLECGRALNSYSSFNDYLIEVELTANRGDCLSVRGIARDLSAAFDKDLEKVADFEDEKKVGIGRIVTLSATDVSEVDLCYRAIDLKQIKVPLLLELRLALIEEQQENGLANLLFYATYSTGVVLRSYVKSLYSTGDEKAKITVAKNEHGYAIVKGHAQTSVIGVNQEDNTWGSPGDDTVLLEASYINPEYISQRMHQHPYKSDALYYRTSRGSECDLEMGMDYLLTLVELSCEYNLFGGSVDYRSNKKEVIVSVDLSEINALIGAELSKTTVVQVLKNLEFDTSKSRNEALVIKVPLFRHDVRNKQDIIEEVLRLVGIDNITSKPLVFSEAQRMNDDYALFQKQKRYRTYAADSGFNESVSFVFTDKSVLEKYGFTLLPNAHELTNPIANTLDTLRQTLIFGLLEAAEKNVKVGYKNIALFECGSVFCQNRKEKGMLSLLYSGACEEEYVDNAGKPSLIDFGTFVKKVSSVVGDIELRNCEKPNRLMDPYQAADVYRRGEKIGRLFKLHREVQDDYELSDTYCCEIEFEKLGESSCMVKPYSIYQASVRDISVLISKEKSYEEVKQLLGNQKIANLVKFYPVDIFEDKSLKDKKSLTLRFVFQSMDKTLDEEEINNATESVLQLLKENIGAELR